MKGVAYEQTQVACGVVVGESGLALGMEESEGRACDQV